MKKYNKLKNRKERCFLEAEELAHAAIDRLGELQAGEITLLDISKTSGFADYFILATAYSTPQFRALCDGIESHFEELGETIHHREGVSTGGWALLDFRDVIIHIFSPEKRTFYQLETLWGQNAPIVHFNE